MRAAETCPTHCGVLIKVPRCLSSAFWTGCCGVWRFVVSRNWCVTARLSAPVFPLLSPPDRHRGEAARHKASRRPLTASSSPLASFTAWKPKQDEAAARTRRENVALFTSEVLGGNGGIRRLFDWFELKMLYGIRIITIPNPSTSMKNIVSNRCDS